MIGYNPFIVTIQANDSFVLKCNYFLEIMEMNTKLLIPYYQIYTS